MRHLKVLAVEAFSAYPLNIAIEAKNVENPVCIHFGRLQTIDHHDWWLCMSTVFSWWWWRWGSILTTVALTSPAPLWASHRRTHTASIIPTITLVLVPVPPWQADTRAMIADFQHSHITAILNDSTQHHLTATVDLCTQIKPQSSPVFVSERVGVRQEPYRTL